MLGAVFARAIATFLVAKGLVTQCQVQVRSRPGAVRVDWSVYAYDYPSPARDHKIRQAVEAEFDLRLGEVERRMKLRSSHLATVMKGYGRLFGSYESPWEYKRH